MTIEHASALRRKTLAPTVAEIRAAAAKGITLSSQALRELRAQNKKATAVRSAEPTKAQPQPNASNLQTIAALQAENFGLQRELKASNRRLAKVLLISR